MYGNTHVVEKADVVSLNHPCEGNSIVSCEPVSSRPVDWADEGPECH